MSPYPDISKKALRELFENFKGLNLLIIGDLILDHYIWGKVDRISPEAPVPVVNVQQKEFRLGGAGNVAANLTSLGVKVTLAGCCGADSLGDQYLTLCKQKNINSSIVLSADRKTTLKTRIIAQHQQLLRIDEEVKDSFPVDVYTQLQNQIQSDARNYDAVIVSDYAKGLLTEEIIQNLLVIFKLKPVLIDPKGYDYRKYRGATTIKPNRNEFVHAIRHLELNNRDIPVFAREMVAELNLKGLVITLGEDGVFTLNEKGESQIIPTKAKEIFDVSGAGDTFIAAFTAALVLSNNWFMAAKAANLASGVAVAKIGTATVTIDEIFNNYDI